MMKSAAVCVTSPAPRRRRWYASSEGGSRPEDSRRVAETRGRARLRKAPMRQHTWDKGDPSSRPEPEGQGSMTPAAEETKPAPRRTSLSSRTFCHTPTRLLSTGELPDPASTHPTHHPSPETASRRPIFTHHAPSTPYAGRLAEPQLQCGQCSGSSRADFGTQTAYETVCGVKCFSHDGNWTVIDGALNLSTAGGAVINLASVPYAPGSLTNPCPTRRLRHQHSPIPPLHTEPHGCSVHDAAQHPVIPNSVILADQLSY
ncbi:hypothetical protein JZ751_008999, partial [Albula glossodonta]